ncbi:MAG: hypothetical protein JNM17_26875 [Archangium sp.]|nr:hypothetical protein [Archangium sp.]
MAMLTIRNLDESVKKALRLRAAQNKRSMEAEARVLLTTAVRQSPPKENLAKWIRQRFKGIETELKLPARTKMRAPPSFD